MKRSKNNRTALGPDVRKLWDYRDLPIGITAIGFEYDMPKTGAWRSIRPVGHEKLAPCREACPAGIDIRGFIEKVRLKKFSEAYDLIQKENPLSRICGRVCFHPCESACNRAELDGPLSVRHLERFVSDVSSHRKRRTLSVRKRRKERVAIIGSGPAGLSGAHYLAQMGYQVHLFEALPKLGGLLRFGIPDYRLPKSVLDEEIRKILSLGVSYETGKQLGQNLRFKDFERYDATFIGIGAWNDLKWDLPAESGEAIFSGIDFLRRVNSRNPPDLTGHTVIIGGGNTAIDVARSVNRLGGKPSVFYRRSRQEMPASPEEIIEAEDEGVVFRFLTSPLRVFRGRQSRLKLECIENRLSTPRRGGRKTPVPIKGSNFFITVDRVVYALGQRPEISGLKDFLRIDHGTKNIWVDDFFETSIPGVFAGGDAALHTRSVASAIGSAKKAAIAIDRYLNGQKDRNIFRGLGLGKKGAVSISGYLDDERISSTAENEVVRYHDLNVEYFKTEDRIQSRLLSSGRRQVTFEEVNLGLTQKMALKEAERCFNCGSCSLCDNCYLYCPEVVVKRGDLHNEIDLDFCKGCGICASECPVGFLQMEPEVNE